jgi:hypothetical protein
MRSRKTQVPLSPLLSRTSVLQQVIIRKKRLLHKKGQEARTAT